MPRHLISDAHEWINELPTVPIYYLAKPQPRERAWQNQRGKKTLNKFNGVQNVAAPAPTLVQQHHNSREAVGETTWYGGAYGRESMVIPWRALTSRRNARKGVGPATAAGLKVRANPRRKPASDPSARGMKFRGTVCMHSW